MIYTWKDGFPTRGVKPEDAAARLDAIRAKGGGMLTPADVVRDARAKRSPLHPLFEWDDGAAAHEYRLAQARGVIRAVVVTTPERPEAPIRAFVSVRESDETGRTYTSTLAALASPSLREQVLAAAKAELASWRRKYDGLLELAEVFAVVDNHVALPTRARAPRPPHAHAA